MKKLKLIDLFSGIGGFSLGLESTGGFETIAFCEINPFCQKVLNKHWPKVKIYDDIKELNGEEFRGTVDVVCGGFPCQDVSISGGGKGITEGERTNLYTEMLRIIGECRPRYAIFENVTGLLSGDSGRWFAKFLYDLAQVGYDAEWHCISASEFGAPHHRDRVWVVAYPNGTVLEGLHFQKPILTNKEESRRRQRSRAINATLPANDYPRFLEDINGIPGKLDEIKSELKAYGNSLFPLIPKMIGKAILKYEAS